MSVAVRDASQEQRCPWPSISQSISHSFMLRAVDFRLEERITDKISHRCKRSYLFFEPFNFFFYLGNHFFVSNLLFLPDLG
jgi:hypothetical protein